MLEDVCDLNIRIDQLQDEVNELTEVRFAQQEQIKKLEAQVNWLVKHVENYGQ